MQRDGEAGQDALQQCVDALEAWLLQVETTASAVDDIKSRGHGSVESRANCGDMFC